MKKFRLKKSTAPAEPEVTETTVAAPAQTTKKPRRAKKPKLSSVTRPWALIKASVHDYRTGWQPLMKIIGVVALPANVAAVFSLTTADQVTSAYVSLASVVMNVAVVWAITQQEATGKVPKVAPAYYDGSAALVRFILVTLALVGMLIPAALGGALYQAGLAVSDAIGSGPEQILIGLAAGVLALPSAYLMVRYGLAPFAAVRDGLRPMAALRRARRVTLGRFWPVAGRLVMLFFYLALLSIPVSLIAALISALKQAALASAVFAFLASLTLLPLADLYLYKLYQELDNALEMELSPDEAIASDTAPATA